MLVLIGENIPAKQLLLEFRELATYGQVPQKSKPGHTNGWGICAYQNQTSSIIKSTLNAANDNLYQITASHLGDNFTGILLAHLRKMSKGKEILAHTHPFLEQSYSFMHNGTIEYPSSDELENDSQIFCSNLVKHSPNGDFLTGYRWIKQNLLQSHIYWTSLNSFIASDQVVWGFRSFSCNEDYYSLYYNLDSSSYTAFCSEKLISLSWALIAKDTVFFTHFSKDSLKFHRI